MSAIWNAVRVWFYARDVFISYSHLEPLYAERLSERLRAHKRRVASYLDQDASWSLARTPRDLLWHARHDRLVAVIATPAAVASAQIRKELRVASRTIVIAVEGAEYGPQWHHPVWVRARGSTDVRLTDEELKAGAFDGAVQRIDRTVGIMRSSTRIALTSTAALLLLAASVIGGSVISRRAMRSGKANSLAGSALNLIGTADHDAALRLAVQSFDLVPDRPSYITESALLRGILRYPNLRRFIKAPDAQRIGAGSLNAQDVRRMQRLPDGRYAVVFGTGALRIIDLASGAAVDLGDAGDTVFTLAVSPSGRWIATAGNGVRLFDVTSGRQVATLLPADAMATFARFAGDARLLCDDHSADVPRIIDWDLSNAQTPRASTRTNAPMQNGTRPTAMDLNVHAHRLAVGHENGTVALYEWPSLKLLWNETEDAKHNDAVWLVRVSPDGSLVVRSSNNAFAIRNAATGEELDGDGEVAVHDAAFHGRAMAMATDAGIRYEIDGKWEHSLPYSATILTVAFSADGKSIIAGSRDEAITVWETPATGILVPPAVAVAHTVRLEDGSRAAFSSDGAILGVGERRKLTHFIDVRTRRESQARPPIPIAMLTANSCDVVDAAHGNAILWRVPLASDKRLAGAVVSSDGRTAAVWFDDSIEVWQADQPKPRERIAMDAPRFVCALSHDGRVLAVGRSNTVVTLHGAVTARFRALQEVEQIAVSSDGAMVAAAARVGDELTLYDSASGLPIGTFPLSRDGIAFSPDGRTLALAQTRAVTLCDVDPRIWRENAAMIIGPSTASAPP